jgi:CDP-glycerol glycerophosphotransferase (TagB/SpsB family)
LREHYGVADQRIHECGVPHFDAHQKLVDPALLRCILNDLNLDSGKPYLFFGMSAPIFAPHEIEIVEWLADKLRRNRFGPDLQLIVRPHPQNVQGNMADRTWLQRLDALRGPRVATNLPLLAEGGLSWDMQQEDLAILVNLLSGCSLCLNSGSTLSIDALAHDKPVVVTLFDADRELPWWRSARRIREFPHYRKLLALGGVRPVGSLAELASEIDAYLADGCRDEAERRESLRQECGSIDGGASRRVARVLSRILGESRDARRAAMERPQTPGRGG